MIGRVNVGGGGRGAAEAFAYIHVTYTAGAVCTATNGSVTLTAPNTSGGVMFAIQEPSSLPETWTIALTNGVMNRSTQVSITAQYQFDDITLLMFKFDNENEVLESRTFNADVKELDNLFDYSSSLLEILEFSKKDIIMINTALEEVFVNVAKYAYDGNGTVEITLSKSKEHVTFVFKDNGKPFNPLEREDPNINAGSDEREIGGLGIFMVKKIMDKVEYEYRNHQNVLTLVKYKSKK